MTQLLGQGYLRLKHIIGDPNAAQPIAPLIPISRSSWWAGVRVGRFPQPVKLGPRMTCWRAEDIQRLIEGGPPVDQVGCSE
jgi:hypothetical protein